MKAGIRISGDTVGNRATRNSIQGNTIALNAGMGVYIPDSKDYGNLVGGTKKGMGNMIIQNIGNDPMIGFNAGVLLSESNAALGNSIYLNGYGGLPGGPSQGIYNGDTAIQIVLNGPHREGDTTQVFWTLSDAISPVGTKYRIEFFSNPNTSEAQGDTYLTFCYAHLRTGGTVGGIENLTGFSQNITATATQLDNKNNPITTSRFFKRPLHGAAAVSRGYASRIASRGDQYREADVDEAAIHGSFPDDLHQHPLSPAAVELPVKYLLPRPEVELPLRDGDDHLPPHDLPLEVGIRIILPRPVVVVMLDRFMRRQFLQPHAS